MRVSVAGNLTRDPELKITPGGRALCTFSVAESRTWTDTTGEKQEQVSFWEVECWGQLAENVADSHGKGDRVMVEGEAYQDRWQTPEGENRSKTKVRALDVGGSERWATASIKRNVKADQPAPAYTPA